MKKQTKIDLAELKRLYDQDVSDYKIGKKLRVNRRRISYYRKKMGLPAKYKFSTSNISRVNYKEFKRLRKERRLNAQDLAKKFEISLVYAYYLLRKFGLSAKRGETIKAKWQKIWQEREKSLLEVIEARGYVTPEEAKKILKTRWLSGLEIRHKIPEIKEIRLIGGGKGHARKFNTYEMFDGFTLERIWYSKESHPGFIAFVANLLPSNLPANTRRAITQHLRRHGLSLETIHKIYIQKIGRSYKEKSYILKGT